jgi:ATP-dependent RNA helicase HelY
MAGSPDPAPVNAAGYLADLPFPADRFQVEAAAAVDGGASVIVTAPTGSGKTVVAEAAIARALGRGRRAVYTTPLKALSNQKFGDFRRAHGEDRVGLLTGDNSINGTAPIVVMTTEVLRNMMYAGSPDLDDVGVVVLDEVHYLQDPARGGVWEEIIIHLDRRIPLVALSATIANPEELAGWLRDRRGDTVLVVETERPVPLESHYMIRDRWEGGALRLLPVFHGNRPNERIARMLRGGGAARRYGAPRRHETCELLRARHLLPAIFFIFSRKGCDEAANSVVDRGLRLTGASEADEIVRIADAATGHLRPDDLAVLGYGRWLHNLRAGVASHHAGLVPAMKETVERLFSSGLVRLVFATETLALGINMPARTVVLENLSKFTGEGHELIQPGDYTQLTGRAGRRGIDTQGTAVILHSAFVPFERVAGIAARGSHPLRSSFRPTYNMAVNLVARYDRDRAETLLASSFAQFTEKRRRSELGRAIAEDEARLVDLRAAAFHPDVDVWGLVDTPPPTRDSVLAEFASRTNPGDVLEWEERGSRARHAVVARGTGKRPRLLMVSEFAELRRIASDRIPDTVTKTGRVDLPRPFRPRDAAYRHRVADLLTRHRPRTEERVTLEGPPDLPGLGTALAAARAARRLERRIEARNRHAAALGPGIVPGFRALLGLLERHGYVRGWSLTPKGERLRRLYNEMDLVLAESLAERLLDGLDGPETAALVSAFTFEPRRDPGEPTWPAAIERRASRIEELWRAIAAEEAGAGLPPTRPPEPGLAVPVARWAAGEQLADLFAEDSNVGDFVRNCRQLIDLLRQVSDVEGSRLPGVRQAILGLDRGVVAAAGAL